MTASSEFNHVAANSSLAPDTVLQNRYRIVRQLGRGGMGAVYEAVDQRLGIAVALKETLSSEASMRKQFEREAQLLAGMQHPALPRVTDHFVEGERAFLVMQFIGGVDLARIISQQPGPFPRDQVIAWADQLLDALIYLHSRDRQVIHRDIKPHNLKLTATGQIALLDFGLAKAQPSDPSVTSSRAFFGYTKHYAPLEQIQDQRTDPRSDIYALGATLYHLLTGIKPPDAMMRATALVNAEPDPLKPANQIHESVGPQIAAILSKAMAQKPEDRYASASEFREALRRLGRESNTGVERKINAAVRTASKADTEKVTTLPPVEPTVLKMAVVSSTRRFGPAAITTVFFVVLALAVGILYGWQPWFNSLDEVAAAAPASTVAVQRQPSAAGKAERPRTVASPVPAKTRNSTEAKTNASANEKKPAIAVINSQAGLARRSQQAVSNKPRKSQRRIDAPSIRLPNPEFPDNVAANTTENSFPAYRFSGGGPKFYRAADGTQIVKFSDGSTRVVRPGETTARSEDSHQR